MTISRKPKKASEGFALKPRKVQTTWYVIPVVVDRNQGRLYVTNRDTAIIPVLDTVSGRLMEAFPVGVRPGGLAFDANRNTDYAALEGENSVLELSTDAILRSLHEFEVGELPVQIALDRQRNRVIVTRVVSGDLTIIGPETREMRSASAGQAPSGVVANEALGRFHIAAQGSSELFAFDTGNVSLIRSLKLDLDSSPAALALDPKNRSSLRRDARPSGDLGV